MAASVSSEKKVETAVTTLLNVRRGAEAIEFYTRAFGAIILSRIDAPTEASSHNSPRQRRILARRRIHYPPELQP